MSNHTINPLDRLRARALLMPRNADERRRWAEGFNSSEFFTRIGMELDLSDSHVTQVHLKKLSQFHMGGLGAPVVVNGAIIAGMFDIGLGISGTQQFPDRPTGTVDLSIKLMKPTTGPTVTLFAWAVEKRTNVVFVEAEVHDASGRTAMGQGIVSASATLSKLLKEKA